MISRITAEFEAPELAESAVRRVRESVGGIYRTGIVCNRKAERNEQLRNATMYTVLPMAPTAQNYITAVMESPASVDVVPEPQRNRTSGAYVICEDTSLANISAVFNAMGGLNIRTGQ